MQNKLLNIFLVAIGCFLFIIVLRKSELARANIGTLRSMFSPSLGLSVFCMMLIPFVRMYRWKLISKSFLVTRLSFRRAYIETGASFFLAVLTPAKIGDISRGMFSNRKVPALIAVMYEMVCDLTILILLSSGFFVMILSWQGSLVYIICICCFIVATPYFFDKILPLLFAKTGGDLSAQLTDDFTKKGGMLKFHYGMLLMSVMVQGLYICSGYFLVKAQGSHLPFLSIAVALAIGQTAGVAAMVPMGLGIREFVSLKYLNLFGYQAVAWSQVLILLRIVSMINVVSGFICYLVLVNSKGREDIIESPGLEV